MLRRNTLITAFVICWTLAFHYESLRAGYLSPLLKRELPKLPLLFPPAGWIMFFTIDRSYGFAQVYGIREGEAIEVDPHAIFETRAVGYDNIRRNVLIGVLSRPLAPSFCRYLHRKFPAYESFAVRACEYPDVVESHDRVVCQTAYRCQ